MQTPELLKLLESNVDIKSDDLVFLNGKLLSTENRERPNGIPLRELLANIKEGEMLLKSLHLALTHMRNLADDAIAKGLGDTVQDSEHQHEQLTALDISCTELRKGDWVILVDDSNNVDHHGDFDLTPAVQYEIKGVNPGSAVTPPMITLKGSTASWLFSSRFAKVQKRN